MQYYPGTLGFFSHRSTAFFFLTDKSLTMWKLQGAHSIQPEWEVEGNCNEYNTCMYPYLYKIFFILIKPLHMHQSLYKTSTTFIMPLLLHLGITSLSEIMKSEMTYTEQKTFKSTFYSIIIYLNQWQNRWHVKNILCRNL